MTDRKLLELAAKAAGIQVVGLVNNMIAQPDHRKDGFIVRNDRGGDSCWNPLTDDGDALRLAVRLSIDYKVRSGATWVCWPEGEHSAYLHHEPHNREPYAATRRAIVRAAAEIGKALYDSTPSA